MQNFFLGMQVLFLGTQKTFLGVQNITPNKLKEFKNLKKK
jgi:hypothetical protein